MLSFVRHSLVSTKRCHQTHTKGRKPDHAALLKERRLQPLTSHGVTRTVVRRRRHFSTRPGAGGLPHSFPDP